jgi:hypothetical protein
VLASGLATRSTFLVLTIGMVRSVNLVLARWVTRSAFLVITAINDSFSLIGTERKRLPLRSNLLVLSTFLTRSSILVLSNYMNK